MRPIRAHVTISAPREQVYDLVGDLAARVAWCDHYQTDYHLTRPRSSGEGAAARFHAKAPFSKTWVEVSIVEASRPRVIRERLRLGRLGRTPGFVEDTFEPLGGGRAVGARGPPPGGVDSPWEPLGGAMRVALVLGPEPATRLDAFKESLGARR